MNLTETRKKVVNDGISNFEHRQTADDDDEGMDLHKKNRCCREPPAWEGLLVHITDFFLRSSLDHHAPRISYLELATTILLRSNTKEADQLS